MSDFTEADVTAAVDALNRYAEHHLNESRARVVLAAVAPAMRDRWEKAERERIAGWLRADGRAEWLTGADMPLESAARALDAVAGCIERGQAVTSDE